MSAPLPPAEGRTAALLRAPADDATYRDAC